ncbi:lysosomal alpha-glucosidase-like [Gigantopelta aegis]|uniref:lysosomal alpha-glucosidase-like n=1 Tax=Gigantopelta aegis TaxID=1735272 RepID=UPI001B88DB16|nr:lysosomal alpha-glucosidase-like [Gigantopelta aegis]
MEVDLQPSADKDRAGLTYRTIGGVLDLYMFTGPTMDAVVQQYTSLIGKPFLPPFWALGFHLCKYGYNSSLKLKKVIARNRAANMPYDVQWTDIDYMKEHLDWTYNKFSFVGLPDIVRDLHSHDQKYVIIVDPGISNTQTPGSYPPYDDGLKQDVFVKTYNGSNLVGKVWPGDTVFPDFFHPKAADWWYRHANTFHNTLPFDGLWTDMNEPSNFVDGSVSGCTSSKLDNPPFVPPNLDGSVLSSRTVCPSAKQFVSSHYNVHSLYGFSEARATMQTLQKILGKRSIVISRSTYPGSGQYGGHWLGDNRSGWKDIYYSIPGILKFQLFGIPFVGADVCGFGGVTTRELCIRWMQLGAFYPFMRNHDALHQKDQDPGSFDKEAQDMMRSALELRYGLLPFLYTLLYRSHVDGLPAARPLVFQYTDDSAIQSIDKQFLWGTSLLISPCLEQAATSVVSFIPNDMWYDYYNGSLLPNTDLYVTLDAPLNRINVHVRGGSIVPRMTPAVTTKQMRRNKFGLLIVTGHDGKASGELYWDDGEVLDPVETQRFTLISFTLEDRTLNNKIEESYYKPPEGIVLGNLTVMGVTPKPSNVKVNGKDVNFTFNDKTEMLTVGDLAVDMLKPFIVIW